MTRETIALFGGAFNPVHNGHVHLVESFMRAGRFDRIFIIPSRRSPHKSSEELVSNEDRFLMCVLAFENIPNVEICDIEFNMPGKSYTINTLEKLQQLLPNADFSFILGSDMLFQFHHWFAYEKILRIVGLTAGARDREEYEKMQEAAQALQRQGGTVTLLDVKPMPVSSTEIRDKVRSGESIEHLVPEKVKQYIEKAGLYAS